MGGGDIVGWVKKRLGPDFFPNVQIELGDCESTSSAVGPYNYALQNAGELCMSDNYSLQAGVSTLDIVVLGRHIVGLMTFTEAGQFIAADVNNEQSINTFDLIDLQNIILFIYEDIPNDGNNINYITA